MAIIIFLVVLVILILVHEFGHFIVAKACGIRVDEFGLGFPPKIFGVKYGETTYSINWIPFGGFVKIFGEDPDAESISGPNASRSLINKPKWQQILVLIAGVSFNVIFAWLLISFGFMSGLPTSVSAYPNVHFTDAKVVITNISPGSPAEKAHLKSGDVIVSMTTEASASSGASVKPRILTVDAASTDVVAVQKFIADSADQPITIEIAEGNTRNKIIATPIAGIVDGKVALGVGLDTIGTLRLPIHQALCQGALLTWDLTKSIAVGLTTFLKNIFVAKADLAQVTGPIGIIGLVGDAAHLGFIYLLSFTAFISINLAVINLLPFPALDGGRILFVIIEAIKRSPINPKVANTLNTIGFGLLILLMLVITFHDVFKIFW
jgi:regulator of sigma E protease